jgi:L-fuculose-phosphate aldolase
MLSVAEQIVRAGRWMFERRLSDLAGGNISCREGDLIYMTPTGAGQKYHWELDAGDILSAPWRTDGLLDDPRHSKEAISHLLVLRAFPQVNAVIHSHPFHVMPYCAAQKPIPYVIQSALVYGERCELIAEKPLYSAEQGQEFVERLRGKEQIMAVKAAALLMPRHGILVAGATLDTALDCLERMDTNAFSALAQKWID